MLQAMTYTIDTYHILLQIPLSISVIFTMKNNFLIASRLYVDDIIMLHFLKHSYQNYLKYFKWT
jgi:hypothetical protein